MSISILEEAEGSGRDGGGSSQSTCFKAQMCLGETLWHSLGTALGRQRLVMKRHSKSLV